MCVLCVFCVTLMSRCVQVLCYGECSVNMAPSEQMHTPLYYFPLGAWCCGPGHPVLLHLQIS